MKNLIATLFFAVGCLSATAQLATSNPEYDPFADSTVAGGSSYTPGSYLSGQTSASYASYNSTGTQWWEYGPSISGNPSVIATNQPAIVAGDLPYTGLYSTMGGESVSFGGNGDSALMNFTTGTGGITAGTVYFSFVFQLTDISTLDTNGTYFTSLNNLQSHNSSFNTPNALAARVLVRRSGDGFNIGLQEGGANGSTGFNTAWSSTVFSVGSNIFVAGSYTFNSGAANNDVAQLWINPDSSTFGNNGLTPAPDLTSSGGTDIARVASFVILDHATNEPSGLLDDLRVGLDWADVTPSSNFLIITQNPVNQTLPAGYNATFSVTAAGTQPLNYQWVKNNSIVLSDGGNIVGAHSNILIINNITANDSGNYSVYVTNAFGVVTQSTGAALSLYDPSITNQPQSRTNNFGTTATFSVGATGTGPFAYQWQKDGSNLQDGGNIFGSQSNVLTLTNVAYPDGGNYTVTVSNAFGNSLQSLTATLTVNDPIIKTQPVSATNGVGGTVSFSIVVNGSQPLTYQWFKNGTMYLFDNGNITGSGSNVLTISNISSNDVATYDVLVIGPYGGTVTSRNVTLALLSPITIVDQPNPRAVAAGTAATFAVKTSAGTTSYQWLFDGQPIPDANSFAYVVTNAEAFNVGLYSVIVTNSSGSITSSPVSLSVSNNLVLAETNLVVIRVGDGSQTQSLNGNSIFLDQYTTAGNYINSVDIPDHGSPGIVDIGLDNVGGVNTGSTTGSSLTLSLDDRYLVIAGYVANVSYGTNLATTYAAAVPRGIGLIDSYGQYTLALASTNSVFDQTYWRAAITDGTNNFWGSGGIGGTYYFGLSATGSLVQTTFVNSRSMGLFNGNIYAAEASNPTGVLEIPGLPTSAITPQVLFSGSSGTYDLTVSPDGNLIYVADQRNITSGGGIQRWQFDGANWNLTYTLTNGFGALGPRYITADFSGPNPVLYVTSNDQSLDNNRLISVVDTGAASVGITLAYAGVNETFRGVHFGPAQGSSVLKGPLISYGHNANGLILSWPGAYVLQSSTNVAGPYLDVPGPNNSPYTNNISAGAQQFFRLRN